MHGTLQCTFFDRSLIKQTYTIEQNDCNLKEWIKFRLKAISFSAPLIKRWNKATKLIVLITLLGQEKDKSKNLTFNYLHYFISWWTSTNTWVLIYLSIVHILEIGHNKLSL